MTIFFTGCTHFGYANIIKLAGRPFASVDEMNEVLIERWNSVVETGDIVYHLGDFSWKNPVPYWNRLNGRKHLILGNHDDEARIRALNPSAVSVQNYLMLKEGKHRFVLFHYPIDDWDGRWRGSIHLHAHTHSSALKNPNTPRGTISSHSGPNDSMPSNYPAELTCNRFNVGVDATDFRPISLDDLIRHSSDESLFS